MIQSNTLRAIVFTAWIGACIPPVAGQVSQINCFDVSRTLSTVVLSSGTPLALPDTAGTLALPCTNTIRNFSFKMDFTQNSEKFFEDTTQFIAVLAYKFSTYILAYDKSSNTFKIPSDQANLRDGNYNLTVSSIMCPPYNSTCDNCTITYAFKVAFVDDTSFTVSISTDISPAILTCLPGSSATLTGTPPPNSAFKSQWARFIGDQYVNIPGADSSVYTTTSPGTFLYTLSGPAGCMESNFTTVSAPLLPSIIIAENEQPLNACTQQINGVVVENYGDPGNLELQWTTSGSGILVSGEKTISPIIAALGAYTLSALRLDNSCTATAAVDIVPGEIPTVLAQIVSSAGTETLDCRNPTLTLQASAALSIGTSSYTYLWSTGASGNEITVDAPGIYTVTVTSIATGCLGAADMLVFQNVTFPALQIIRPRDTVCAGESISLTAMALEPVTYRWQNNTTTSSLIVTPSQPGPNTYSVTITTNSNGCTSSASVVIERVEPPEISCLMDALTVPTGDQATLDCPYSGNQLIWLAVSTNVRNVPPTGTNPVQGQIFELIDPRAPGTVDFTLYAKNNGCTSVPAGVRVTVLPESTDNVYIPELITPNGDGVNDRWEIIIPSTISNPEAWRLSLFNRLGALVWDAHLATPFEVEKYAEGTYYYLLQKPDGGDIRGAVTILRQR